MRRVDEQAAASIIRDLDGREVTLGSTWRDRTAVLVFVRHFGWLFCREQVAQLRDATPEIHARGAELVVVGCGNRHFATGFRQALRLETPLYVDTRRDAYRALGMRRVSPFAFLSFKVLRNLSRALKAGFRQGRAQGNVWQLGGVLVVRPDAAVAFQYLSNEAGDHPPVADVLASLGSRPA